MRDRSVEATSPAMSDRASPSKMGSKRIIEAPKAGPQNGNIGHVGRTPSRAVGRPTPAFCRGPRGYPLASLLAMKAPCQVWYQTAPPYPFTDSIPLILPSFRVCTV